MDNTSTLKLSDQLRILHQKKVKAYKQSREDAIREVQDIMKKHFLPDLVKRIEDELVIEVNKVPASQSLSSIRLCHVNVFPSKLDAYLKGERHPNADSLKKILDLCNEFNIEFVNSDYEYSILPGNVDQIYKGSPRSRTGYPMDKIQFSRLAMFTPLVHHFIGEGFNHLHIEFPYTKDIANQGMTIVFRIPEQSE